MSLEDKLQQASGAAKEVIDNVKESVEGAVEGIKNTFNK